MMRWGNMLIGKRCGLPGGANVFRRKMYLFREGERRWLPPKSMILPVSICCNTCANLMPHGITLTSVSRHALSKISSGAPIVTLFFNCTKCRAFVQMKEDSENSEHLDEDGLDPETPDSNLKVAVVAKGLWSVVKLVLFMLRKGASKSKLLMDLNMLMKRGKIAGSRAIQNLTLATAGLHRDHCATSVGPRNELGSANSKVKKVLESMLSAGDQLVVEASSALSRSPAGAPAPGNGFAVYVGEGD